MLIMPRQGSEIPLWTRIFIEVVVRALVRVHHEFLLYSINQKPDTEPNFESLNNGPGLAYADELTVCSAIAQEFLATRYVSGVYVNGSPSGSIKEGNRHFRISREYKDQNTNNRYDFFVERIDKDGTVIGHSTLIEAKRAFCWTTKLDDSKDQITDQKSQIFEDIQKLLSINKTNDQLRGYILVWNIQKTSDKTDVGVKEYFSFLKDYDIIPWQIRFSPLSASSNRSNFDTANTILPDYCLWVALAEVTPLRTNDLIP
jgi:hypothetical protein